MLTSGQILENRYRIAKILSQKENETTYRAWDITLNRPCAIRELTDLSPTAAQNFQHQANQISALNHPNLPKLVDFISLPGQGNYLVMEFFDGTSLQNELEKSGRPIGGK